VALLGRGDPDDMAEPPGGAQQEEPGLERALSHFPDEESRNSLFDEKQNDREETQRRAVELRLQKRGKSAKTPIMSEKYWDDYSLRNDPYAQKVLAVHRMLSSAKFDAAIGVIILINAIMIGVQLEYELRNMDVRSLVFIDNIFLCIYVLELGLRFFAYGVHCLDNGWVRFDASLVTMGVGASVLELGLGAEFLESLGPIMVLRILRLLRLARAVRLFPQFKALWMLVRGFLSSAGTMFYTFVLTLLILYLFANLAVELITKDTALRDAEPEFDQLVSQFFPNLFITMLTLLQFATLDGPGVIYGAMIPFKPMTLSIFFVLYILVVSLSLMNLVTANLVQGSLEQASKDKEVNNAYRAVAMKKMIPTIREVFMAMDVDHSGNVCVEEILKAPLEVQEELRKVMEMDDFIELFEILDVDANGTLNAEEYVDGISKLVTSEVPLEQLRLQKTLNIVRNDLKDVMNHHLKNVEDSLRDDIRGGFARLSQGLPPLPLQNEKRESKEFSSIQTRRSYQLT
jgi:voltage-gated sodium channel